tara:strand:- start:65 stop:250 length:186 start_codon:yes stop_codon:yes gene_type:complete
MTECKYLYVVNNGELEVESDLEANDFILGFNDGMIDEMRTIEDLTALEQVVSPIESYKIVL